MFCPKCGTQLPDNAEFCKSCGNQIKSKKTSESPRVSSSFSGISSVKPKYIIAGIIGIIVLIMFILLIKSCGSSSDSSSGEKGKKSGGNSSYEQTFDKYASSIINRDVEGYIKCFPSEMASGLEADYKQFRASGGISQFAFVNSSPDFDYSYSVENIEQLPADEVNDLRSPDGLEIEEAYSATVKVKWSYGMSIDGAQMPGTASSYIDSTVIVGKIGKGWYVISGFKRLNGMGVQ